MGFGVLRSRLEVRSYGGEGSCGVTEVKGVAELLGSTELSGDPELSGVRS